ncbi:hypothetical protein Hanom_Chr11g01025641 [Helianthus anomalus]
MLALFASVDRFKGSMLREPDPGQDYEKLMGDYYSKKKAKRPTSMKMIEHWVPISANKSKGGDLTELVSKRAQAESRFFLEKELSNDAFKVVEVELNFIYDILFTMLPVVYGVTNGTNPVTSVPLDSYLFPAIMCF